MCAVDNLHEGESIVGSPEGIPWSSGSKLTVFFFTTLQEKTVENFNGKNV